MKTIGFEGASDDLIEIDGDDRYDELSYLTSGPDTPWTAVVTDEATNEALTVMVWYGNEGTWFVGLGILDEEEDFPDWPSRIFRSPHTQYSLRLELDVPDTARITWVSRGADN